MYTSYTNLGRQEWIILTRPAQHLRQLCRLDQRSYDSYGASIGESGVKRSLIGQVSPGYSSQGARGSRQSRKGATVDLADAVNVSNLQAGRNDSRECRST